MADFWKDYGSAVATAVSAAGTIGIGIALYFKDIDYERITAPSQAQSAATTQLGTDLTAATTQMGTTLRDATTQMGTDLGARLDRILEADTANQEALTGQLGQINTTLQAINDRLAPAAPATPGAPAPGAPPAPGAQNPADPAYLDPSQPNGRVDESQPGYSVRRHWTFRPAGASSNHQSSHYTLGADAAPTDEVLAIGETMHRALATGVLNGYLPDDSGASVLRACLQADVSPADGHIVLEEAQALALQWAARRGSGTPGSQPDTAAPQFRNRTN